MYDHYYLNAAALAVATAVAPAITKVCRRGKKLHMHGMNRIASLLSNIFDPQENAMA